MYASDLRHPDPGLEQKLQAIYHLRRDGKTLDLTLRSPYFDLLQKLGNPHKALPPVIHVAGTNGKGSVIATLRAILEAAGYRVHVYTSPHLHRFNERIVLAGAEITDDYLTVLIDEVMTHAKGLPLTFFEVTTALAFKAFADNPADILLLETGLGGRLDCTNVVERPEATVITRIGYDHTDLLGYTLPAIAREKAGIIKPGVPVIVGMQDSEDISIVFEECAHALNAPLHRHGPGWIIEPYMNRMRFTGRDGEKTLDRPALKGPHQIENAGAALACLETLTRFPVPAEALAQGLQNTRWPGRLQQVTTGPLAALLPPGWELWYDGGHNESAARVLAAQAKLWREEDGRPLYLILGMMAHKDPEEFISPLINYVNLIYTIGIKGEHKAFSAAALACLIPGAQQAADVEEVLRSLPLRPPGRILITGSLYLAGQIGA